MYHEIAILGNSFSQILHFISSSGGSMSSTYNSSSVYVLECIILLCLSADPRSYNSDHTNNTYVFVVVETGQSFLSEGYQCVL